MKYWIRFAVSVGVFSAILGCRDSTETRLELRSVRFRIVAERDEKPLANRELRVFDRRAEDVVLEFVRTRAVSQGYYLTSVTTDNDGLFTLDLSDTRITDFAIQPGPPNDIVRFERASDVGHTKSPYHIRVVRFEKGTQQVARNDIYDLRRATVRRIHIAGGEEQASYREILLAAPDLLQKDRQVAPADVDKQHH